MSCIETYNPATGTLINSFEKDSAASIHDKVVRARAALKTWRHTPMQLRCDAIKIFAELLNESRDICAADLSCETGKPIGQAAGEVKGTQGRLSFFLEHAPAVMETQVLADHQSGTAEEIRYEPLGVVVNISAWNYPYFVGTNVIVPALLTGNVVLYKPSELALQTGVHITRLLHQAGIPKDVFQMIVGDGVTGAQLLDENIDGVFFTGSYATGKKIAEHTAGRMLKLQLELGGKDPAYICEDVNIDKVAKNIVEGCFYNAGQSCCAIERVYIASGIYEEFTEAFVSAAKDWRIGDPKNQATRLGPLTRPAQSTVLDAQVSDALAQGATLLLPGGPDDRPGSFYRPVVLGDTTHKMTVMKEESFGPIIGLQPVKSDEEALTLMQDTSYGLTASVFTQDEDRAQKLLAQIDSGTVYWNCSDRVSPHLPWSGRGHSGVGLTCSVAGIQTFVRPKAWQLRRP